MVKRRKLVIYYDSNIVLNQIKDIKSLNIVYASENNYFSIIYVDANQFDELFKKLSNSNLITKIDVDDTIFEF
ncbi:MAG: DUF2129 domain-containing protein [Acholeplasmatales bacterium]|nr:DUF2129 domain-containing protein [Acholeplasmatales bacterium]